MYVSSWLTAPNAAVASDPKRLTKTSTATSASETTIVCTPVGIPMRTSLTSSSRSGHRCVKTPPSASGLRRISSHIHWTIRPATIATALATGIPETPSFGRPHAPRMSTGVDPMKITSLIAKTISGVRESPRPRSSAV